MAKDPAFLFYPGDWLGGTMHLNWECKGAYLDILMLQFNRGHVTIHMVGQLLGQKLDEIWPQIKDKFKTDGTIFWNERLKNEKEKRENFTASRRNNVSGKNQHSDKDKKKEGHMTHHMEDENENRNKGLNKKKKESENFVEDEKFPFAVFWDLYDKKVGDKEALTRKWYSLPMECREKAFTHIPLYKAAEPNKKFRQHPKTYLNQKSWNDEIITDNGNGKPKQTTNDRRSGVENLKGFAGAVLRSDSDL